MHSTTKTDTHTMTQTFVTQSTSQAFAGFKPAPALAYLALRRQAPLPRIADEGITHRVHRRRERMLLERLYAGLHAQYHTAARCENAVAACNI